MVAWHLAMYLPKSVERLIILNAPHPRALNREMVHNAAQVERSRYAQDLKKEGVDRIIGKNPEALLFWNCDAEEKEKHAEALRKSDFTAVLSYFPANYPDEPYEIDTSVMVKVKAPVLIIHGIDDSAFVPETLNNAWEWSEREVTVAMLPGVQHFVQHEAPERVTEIIQDWLSR
jgi:pimeloyl-ACP methyl ester carboxylesterase